MMLLDCPAYPTRESPVSCGLPAEAKAEISRPNTAPAYYLGRPAHQWITVMRPRRKRLRADRA